MLVNLSSPRLILCSNFLSALSIGVDIFCDLLLGFCLFAWKNINILLIAFKLNHLIAVLSVQMATKLWNDGEMVQFNTKVKLIPEQRLFCMRATLHLNYKCIGKHFAVTAYLLIVASSESRVALGEISSRLIPIPLVIFILLIRILTVLSPFVKIYLRDLCFQRWCDPGRRIRTRLSTVYYF